MTGGELMKLPIAGAIAVLAVAAVAMPAFAIVYNFPLEGIQEVPPTPSPATGSCTVNLDEGTGAVSVSCTYSGLLGNATAAHIHGLAPPGTNAGVIVGLTVSGGTTGTVTGGGTLSPANTAGMLAGQTYVNVHSSLFPGGEIRGQIVPEPATLGLLAIGGLLATRRRRN